MSLVYLAIGSNQGDSIEICKQAAVYLDQLPNSCVIAHSSLYRSKAMLLPEQPPQDDYINAVIGVETTLSPFKLLAETQKIEQCFGRIRMQRWGARTLDIDILLYDNIELMSELLTIPHYGLQTRSFVVYPLYEIAPLLILPNGHKVAALVASLADNELQKIGTFLGK